MLSCVKPTETLLMACRVVLKLLPGINRSEVHVESKALGNQWLWHLISTENILLQNIH